MLGLGLVLGLGLGLGCVGYSKVIPKVVPNMAGRPDQSQGELTVALKGEYVAAAILLSRMKVSYCTSGFFHS